MTSLPIREIVYGNKQEMMRSLLSEMQAAFDVLDSIVNHRRIMSASALSVTRDQIAHLRATCNDLLRQYTKAQSLLAYIVAIVDSIVCPTIRESLAKDHKDATEGVEKIDRTILKSAHMMQTILQNMLYEVQRRDQREPEAYASGMSEFLIRSRN